MWAYSLSLFFSVPILSLSLCFLPFVYPLRTHSVSVSSFSFLITLLFNPRIWFPNENLRWICAVLMSRTPIWVHFCCGIRFPRGRFHAIWPRWEVSGLKMEDCSRSGLLRASLPPWSWKPWARRTTIIHLLLVISLCVFVDLDFEFVFRWKILVDYELEANLCGKFWPVFP